MFKVGDEVVKYRNGGPGVDLSCKLSAPIGSTGTVVSIGISRFSNMPFIRLAEWPHGEKEGHAAFNWRKVQRKTTDLSIESFLTIRPGFEEPRKVTLPVREKA